jgi:tetratricopeptide (TPR) repeat protein
MSFWDNLFKQRVGNRAGRGEVALDARAKCETERECWERREREGAVNSEFQATIRESSPSWKNGSLKDPESLLKLANAFFDMGDYARAEQVYSALINLVRALPVDPVFSNEQGIPDILLTAVSLRGNARHKQAKFEEALFDYQFTLDHADSPSTRDQISKEARLARERKVFRDGS